MDINFIKKFTKRQCVLNVVFSAIALITLVMVAVLINVTPDKKSLIAFCFTIILVFISTLSLGSIQIRVFNDYKSQKKALCADGIFIISLGILLCIIAALFAFVQGEKAILGTLDTVDIRYFIVVFLLAFAVWKSIVTYHAIKEKRKNWWLELTGVILWVAFAALTLVSMFVSTETMELVKWLFVAAGWLMVVNNIVYQLYSYIFNKPDYLVTEEAVRLYEKEETEKRNRQARLNALTGEIGFGNPLQQQVQVQPQTQPKEESIEEKLEKLKNLLDKQIITQEEYDEKRKKLVDQL